MLFAIKVGSIRGDIFKIWILVSGLSVPDGKRIMSTLQELVMKRELAAHFGACRTYPSSERFQSGQGLYDV